MNDGGLIKTLSLPSTHPWASERFHCIRRTLSQREYKCKSKCLDAIEGPLFIESIIICRLGAERPRITTGNWYTRRCLHVAIKGGGGAHTGTGEQGCSHTVAAKTCAWRQFCKKNGLQKIQIVACFNSTINKIQLGCSQSLNDAVQFSISLSTWSKIRSL